MKIFIGTLFFIFFSTSLYCQEYSADKLEIYEEFREFSTLLSKDNDTTYVINFWATWCKPCVKELPFFEEIHEKNRNSAVKVILVSLDFQRHIEKKLIPFLQKNKLQSEVVLFTDPKQQIWIDKVDSGWSGAIPATYFYKGDLHYFYEGEFETIKEIESYITKLNKS